jgi:hypothetical protein
MRNGIYDRDGKKKMMTRYLYALAGGIRMGEGDGREYKRALNTPRRCGKFKIDGEILDKHSKYFEAV